MGLIVAAYDFCMEKKRGGDQTPTQALMGLQSKKSRLNVSAFNTKHQLDNAGVKETTGIVGVVVFGACKGVFSSAPSQALGWLAAVFGVSNTILEVIVPYSHMPIIQLLGKVHVRCLVKCLTEVILHVLPLFMTIDVDFDGDKMNMHIPQTKEARTEALMLIGLKTIYAHQRMGRFLVASTQDFLTSSFLTTIKDILYDPASFALLKYDRKHKGVIVYICNNHGLRDVYESDRNIAITASEPLAVLVNKIITNVRYWQPSPPPPTTGRHLTHLSDPSHSPVSERMDRSGTGSHHRTSISHKLNLEDNNGGNFDSFSNASLMETETRSRAQTRSASAITIYYRERCSDGGRS
ncbi:unnamed protein product [Lactuca virosa]|uniref:RNA polymerase alpha subunit domain-containing protein n=1 Tax=Lactuca virosa TaxID=75947 RepID=A0AAU9M1X4_9ASTR|nr:unnamed protein product [Lactuca virosa]